MGPTREQYANERRFFIDYWNLRKKYYDAVNEPDSFWENLVRDVRETEKKYPGRYYQDLLIALVADIETRAKGGEESDQ